MIAVKLMDNFMSDIVDVKLVSNRTRVAGCAFCLSAGNNRARGSNASTKGAEHMSNVVVCIKDGSIQNRLVLVIGLVGRQIQVRISRYRVIGEDDRSFDRIRE